MPVQRVYPTPANVLRLALLTLLIVPPVTAEPLRVKAHDATPAFIDKSAEACDPAGHGQDPGCATRAQAVAMRPNAGRYCVMTATHIAVCNYADRAICARDAGLVDGTCTDSPAKLGGASAATSP